MHPTYRPFVSIECDIGLRDDGVEAVLGKLFLAESSGEEAAVVFLPIEIDHERIRGRGNDESINRDEMAVFQQ